MYTITSATFLCLIGIVCAQNGYPRDVPNNQLSYDGSSQEYNQGYSQDEGESSGGEIPGEPGTDYPVYSEVPQTSFSCSNQQFPGYYADPEAQCQAFYICQRDGKSDGFLCPNGTLFNQEFLVCDWWYNFDCSRAESLYGINEQIVRAMEEADARLAQQGFGRLENFNENGHNGNGNGHNRNENVHNGNGNGHNEIGNGNNGKNNGFNGNEQKLNGNGHNGNKHGNGFNGNGNGQNENGNGYTYKQNGNGLNGNGYTGNGNGHNGNGHNGNGKYTNGNGAKVNGNGNGQIPKPVYGAPATGPQISSQFNGFNSNGFAAQKNGNGYHKNGNGNGHNLNGNGDSYSLNGNGNSLKPKPVYGTPSQFTSNGNGFASQQNGNGYNKNGNGNGSYKNGNGNGIHANGKGSYRNGNGNGAHTNNGNGKYQNGNGAFKNGNENGNHKNGNGNTLAISGGLSAPSAGGQVYRNGLGNAPSSLERSYLPANGNGHSDMIEIVNDFSQGSDSYSGNVPSADHAAEPDRSYLPSL